MAMHFCISASASHGVRSLGKSLVLMLEDYFGIQSTCYPAAWIILELVVGCLCTLQTQPVLHSSGD